MDVRISMGIKSVVVSFTIDFILLLPFFAYAARQDFTQIVVGLPRDGR